MCNSNDCCGCPLKQITCITPSVINSIDKLIDFTEKWCDENPKITNRNKFFEVFGITIGDAFMKPNWESDEYKEIK